MKKRRTLVVGLLLVAALALGIGYAGFTSDLSISGESIINGVTESHVVITSIVLDAANSSEGMAAVAECGTNGTKAATVDITGFDAEDEYAVLTVTVSNPHQVVVNLSDPVITPGATNKDSDGNDYFTYEILDASSIPDTIAKESTVTFQIKVTCNKIEPDSYTSNFTVTFTASTRPTETETGA